MTSMVELCTLWWLFGVPLWQELPSQYNLTQGLEALFSTSDHALKLMQQSLQRT